MKIVTLLENRTESKELKNKHGLSLYIETNGIKVVFDTGPDDTFIENARKLGVDISDVDLLVISHGHKDHGGGLEAFIKTNDKAKIIASKYAFDKYYARVSKLLEINIGLNPTFMNHERVQLIEGLTDLGNGMLVFDGVKPDKLLPSSNKKLLMRDERGLLEDDFKHEINLIISEGDKKSLICGCSHLGIGNIIDQAEDLIQGNINTAVGGMHLYDPIGKKYESEEFIDNLGETLLAKRVNNYYTCHCTGEKAYSLLKTQMGDKINELKTGKTIII
ncbi:MBL fold metallo-hydrolase [Wukongibacter baidiensis]|uniref:MBL fold metallo-hydrolase n=1 Tax=Wukongibacter baidiensis TaxID=1723361 RepID=UPI003D7F56EB